MCGEKIPMYCPQLQDRSANSCFTPPLLQSVNTTFRLTKIIFDFLAVQNSSIGDLVTHWLTHSLSFDFNITEWPLRLVTSETFDQSDGETWPDQKIPTYLPIYIPNYLCTSIREHPKSHSYFRVFVTFFNKFFKKKLSENFEIFGKRHSVGR